MDILTWQLETMNGILLTTLMKIQGPPVVVGSPNTVKTGQIVNGSILDMSFKRHEMKEMNVSTLH